MSTWCKVSHHSCPVCGDLANHPDLYLSVLLSAGPAVHKHQYSANHAVTDINLDNVCKKGNTLLWDLVQDEDAVRSSDFQISA